jgi:hypothetical protein
LSIKYCWILVRCTGVLDRSPYSVAMGILHPMEAQTVVLSFPESFVGDRARINRITATIAGTSSRLRNAFSASTMTASFGIG